MMFYLENQEQEKVLKQQIFEEKYKLTHISTGDVLL
jgi:hypothetical protein